MPLCRPAFGCLHDQHGTAQAIKPAIFGLGIDLLGENISQFVILFHFQQRIKCGLHGEFIGFFVVEQLLNILVSISDLFRLNCSMTFSCHAPKLFGSASVASFKSFRRAS